MSSERREDAENLLRLMDDFQKREGTKKGALLSAAKKVYGSTVPEHIAQQRANKTLSEYRRRSRS
jgi:hypothetical protein